MSPNKIHVFTDADLDGTISYMTLCWFFDRKLPVTVTTESNFLQDYNAFLKNNNPDYFSRIYILDMSVVKHIELIDKKNVTIVDHHLDSVKCDKVFKHARTLFKEEGSTCKLLYNKLKESFKKDVTQKQKILISLGHDYDSYTLKHKEVSLGLNTLFWNLQGNRNEKFTDKYYEGFGGFTNEDVRIISFYKNKIEKHLKETPIYYGTVPISDKNVKVCSTFADFNINEIAQEIIERTNSDIGIVVNLRTESVSFRKSKTCTVNLNNLANKISDGGGHDAAAGGKLTKTFMEFSKLLPNIW